MRIQVRLPKIEPNVYEKPEKCPYGCGGMHYRAHGVQGESKALLDVGYKEVRAYRYKCMRCGGTFRVYPRGVSKGAQQSKRFKGMTVLLYVLGLSYGAVEDFTSALGCGASKTPVYNNVQEAGVVARKKQREEVKSKGKRAVIGADGAYTAEQVLADLVQLQRLVRERPPDGEAQLATLYERYQDIPTPPPGTRHSVW